MVSKYTLLGALSSVILQASAFSFLRWIPGHHFPPIVLSCLAVSIYCALKVLNGNGTSADSSKVLPKRHRDGTSLNRTPATQAPTGDMPSLWTSFKILMVGAPDCSHPRWSIVAATKNVILTLAVLDMVVRGPLFYPSKDLSLLRVGYVSDDRAWILVREPDQSRMPLTIWHRELHTQSWDVQALWTETGTVRLTTDEDDFTATAVATNLEASTKYQVSTNGRTVEFTTAPRKGEATGTSPRITFLTSSCIKPRFPYNPRDHPLAIPGLQFLATWIPRLGASFMLFLGDFIYIDVPHRFGSTRDTYRAEYRRVYDSPSWPAASGALPWIHVIDDHEIANDWDRGIAPPYPAAFDPFRIYHHSVNPPTAMASSTGYTFTNGPATFFLLDTRRHRSPSGAAPATDPKKTILGAEQLTALLAWLRRPESHGVRFKIIVSSVPMTRNWRVNAADTWAGYLHERQIILETAWDFVSENPHIGVVVLSGDRHEFAATRFPVPSNGSEVAHIAEKNARRWTEAAAVTEFSCSPLSMFYLPLHTYWEVPGQASGVGAGGEDQRIAYLPSGNSKFGAVEIDSQMLGLDSGQAGLRYRLFIDGKEEWTHFLATGAALK